MKNNLYTFFLYLLLSIFITLIILTVNPKSDLNLKKISESFASPSKSLKNDFFDLGLSRIPFGDNWKISAKFLGKSNTKIFIFSNKNIEHNISAFKLQANLVNFYGINYILHENSPNYKSANNSIKSNYIITHSTNSADERTSDEIFEHKFYNYFKSSNIHIDKINFLTEPPLDKLSSIFYILAKISEKTNLQNPDLVNEQIKLNKNLAISENVYESNLANPNYKYQYILAKDDLLNFYMKSNSWVNEKYNFFASNLLDPYNYYESNFGCYIKNFKEIYHKTTTLNLNIDESILKNFFYCLEYFKNLNSLTQDIFNRLNNLPKTSQRIIINIDPLRINNLCKMLKKAEYSYIILKNK